jgi:hypothetical protein
VDKKGSPGFIIPYKRNLDLIFNHFLMASDVFSISIFSWQETPAIKLKAIINTKYFFMVIVAIVV